MNIRFSLLLLVAWPASLWASVADFSPAKPVIPSRVFNLRDFGAAPTGNASSTEVFHLALAAVEKAGGGTLVVPAGDYFLGPIDLCSNLDFHLEAGAHLRFSQNPADYRIPTAARYRPMIWAQNRHDVVVSGPGVLDGQGQPWWPIARKAYVELRAGRPPGEGIVRPRLLTMDHCERVRLEGVTLLDSPQIQFLASHCDDIEVVRVVAIAPPRSPNTGAVCTSGSSRIVITGCRFDVGDDCIAINGGSSEPAEDIRVTDCTFLHGHGCSIGSDTRGGVRNMLVSHCDFQGTEIGIRLKSGRGRGGLVENVTYSDLTMENVGHAIQLSSYYPESTWPKPGSHDQAQPVTVQTPQWRGLTIRRLTATGGTKDAGRIIGLPESPVTDLTLEDVQIAAPLGLRIGCAKNVTFRNVQVTAGTGEPFLVEDTVDGLVRRN